MKKLDEYLSQDIDNPKYLFHGSSKKIKVLEPNYSHDSNHNLNNIANAVFLFPSFIKATTYAFKDTIKKIPGYMLSWAVLIGIILGTKFGVISLYFLKTYYIWLIIIIIPIVYVCFRINNLKYFVLVFEIVLTTFLLIFNPSHLSESLYNEDYFGVILYNVLTFLYISVSFYNSSRY